MQSVLHFKVFCRDCGLRCLQEPDRSQKSREQLGWWGSWRLKTWQSRIENRSVTYHVWFQRTFINMIPFNVLSILLRRDCSPLPEIIKRQIWSDQGRASTWPRACSADLQSCIVLPLETRALGTKPLGKEMLCLLESVLSPELPPLFSECGSGEMGPWAFLFLLSLSFLNGPRRNRQGRASKVARDSEKAIKWASIQVLLDIMTGPKCWSQLCYHIQLADLRFPSCLFLFILQPSSSFFTERKRLRDPVGVSWTQSEEPLPLGLDSPKGGKRCQLQLMWAVSLAPGTSGYSRCDSMNYLQLWWTTFNCTIAHTPWWELAAWISLTMDEKDRRWGLRNDRCPGSGCRAQQQARGCGLSVPSSEVHRYLKDGVGSGSCKYMRKEINHFIEV